MSRIAKINYLCVFNYSKNQTPSLIKKTRQKPKVASHQMKGSCDKYKLLHFTLTKGNAINQSLEDFERHWVGTKQPSKLQTSVHRLQPVPVFAQAACVSVPVLPTAIGFLQTNLNLLTARGGKMG